MFWNCIKRVKCVKGELLRWNSRNQFVCYCNQYVLFKANWVKFCLIPMNLSLCASLTYSTGSVLLTVINCTNNCNIWGLCCQKRVSQAGISNCIYRIMWMQLLIPAWDTCFRQQSPHIRSYIHAKVGCIYSSMGNYMSHETTYIITDSCPNLGQYLSAIGVTAIVVILAESCL